MEAVALDSNQVNKQVQAIKAREAQKKMLEQKRQQEAEEKIAKLRLQREQEEKKIVELKTKQAEALEQIAASKKAEEIKLAKLKKQQEVEKLAQAAQEKKKKQEEQKKKDLSIQAEKKQVALLKKQQLEAKKRAEMEQQQAEAAEARLASSGEPDDLDEIDRHYVDLIEAKIREKWVQPVPLRLSCATVIELLPGGVVASVQIAKSSGNALFDDSVVRATYKASPLPLPPDPKRFSRFKRFNSNFNSSHFSTAFR